MSSIELPKAGLVPGRIACVQHTTLSTMCRPALITAQSQAFYSFVTAGGACKSAWGPNLPWHDACSLKAEGLKAEARKADAFPNWVWSQQWVK